MKYVKLVYPYQLKIRGKTFDDKWVFFKHPMEEDLPYNDDWFAAISFKKRLYYFFAGPGSEREDNILKGKDFTESLGSEEDFRRLMGV